MVFLVWEPGPIAAAQSGPTSAPQASLTIEDEVLGNLRSQKVNERQTLADYNLPESFLRVIADRVIRTSFEDRYRIVVHDRPTDAAGGGLTTESTGVATNRPAGSRLIRWFGLVLLLPVAITGWVLMARRKKAMQ